MSPTITHFSGASYGGRFRPVAESWRCVLVADGVKLPHFAHKIPERRAQFGPTVIPLSGNNSKMNCADRKKRNYRKEITLPCAAHCRVAFRSSNVHSECENMKYENVAHKQLSGQKISENVIRLYVVCFRETCVHSSTLTGGAAAGGVRSHLRSLYDQPGLYH